MPHSPALFRKGEDGRKKKREVLHLFRCYTHTPGQSRVNPERQEEEKSGHTTGRRPKTAQGGEGNRRTTGTNLHGETDLTKTAHTPKPHDTLRRGTRGKLGTKWGTSWWQTKKPKQLVKQQDSIPKPKGRAIVPQQARVQVSHKGIKRHSSSNELGAQYVSPHQTTIKRKTTTPESREPAWYLCHDMMQCSCKSCCSGKKGVSGCSERSHAEREANHWGPWDVRSRGNSRKRCKTERLTVAHYLNELPS